MTVGSVELAAALGIDGTPSDLVRRVILNASLQTGFSNPKDAAIVQAVGVESVLTEVAVLFVQRTRRLFFQSRPPRNGVAYEQRPLGRAGRCANAPAFVRGAGGRVESAVFRLASDFGAVP